MKAIVLENPGKFKLIEIDNPKPPNSDEVLLKVERVSICGTDLHAYRGNQPFFSYPRILGHEIAARVVEVGSQVSHLQVGDYCTIEPYRNQIIDQAVRRGKTNCGKQMSVLGVHEDGAMCEYFTYNAALVHPVVGLALDQISIVEPLSIACHAIERADIREDDTILIIGAGPIGYGIAAIARLLGVKIALLEVSETRAAIIRHNFPEITVILHNDQIEKELVSVFDGELPTIVLDATGNSKSMERTFDFTAAGGTIVFVGLFIGQVSFDDPTFHRKELTLKASRNARKKDFQKVIELLKANVLPLEGYISHHISFDSLIKEFDKLYDMDQNVMKAIVTFD
jgi:2-desacetyl-2-hydroxyethyl bacteriochlorophyllide A dehydrogenase